MAALIEFVCIAKHDRRGDPSVTLEQRSWAFCPSGATDAHQWTRIDPTAIEMLRSPASNGRSHLVLDEVGERDPSPSPGR